MADRVLALTDQMLRVTTYPRLDQTKDSVVEVEDVSDQSLIQERRAVDKVGARFLAPENGRKTLNEKEKQFSLDALECLFAGDVRRIDCRNALIQCGSLAAAALLMASSQPHLRVVTNIPPSLVKNVPKTSHLADELAWVQQKLGHTRPF